MWLAHISSDLYEHAYVSSSLMLGYKFYNKCQIHIACPINELARVSPTFEAKSHFLNAFLQSLQYGRNNPFTELTVW